MVKKRIDRNGDGNDSARDKLSAGAASACDSGVVGSPKFKVGDKVRVRSKEWFDENYAASANGDIEFFVNSGRDMIAAPYYFLEE